MWHLKAWQEILVPRLYSIARAVYRLRQDAPQRQAWLRAVAAREPQTQWSFLTHCIPHLEEIRPSLPQGLTEKHAIPPGEAPAVVPTGSPELMRAWLQGGTGQETDLARAIAASLGQSLGDLDPAGLPTNPSQGAADPTNVARVSACAAATAGRFDETELEKAMQLSLQERMVPRVRTPGKAFSVPPTSIIILGDISEDEEPPEVPGNPFDDEFGEPLGTEELCAAVLAART